MVIQLLVTGSFASWLLNMCSDNHGGRGLDENHEILSVFAKQMLDKVYSFVDHHKYDIGIPTAYGNN